VTANRRTTYLQQLMSRLLYSGVDGSDVGDLVAEVAQHLEDTGSDPIEEFGPVPEFAVEVIAQRRVRKRAWLRRVALPWLAIVPFAVGFNALVARPADDTVFVSATESFATFAFIAAVVAGIHVMVRRRRGDSRLPPLIGVAVVSGLFAAGSVAGDLIGTDLGATLSNAQRWVVVGVASALLVGALVAARNPVKFPDSFEAGNLAYSPLMRMVRRAAG